MNMLFKRHEFFKSIDYYGIAEFNIFLYIIFFIKNVFIVFFYLYSMWIILFKLLFLPCNVYGNKRIWILRWDEEKVMKNVNLFSLCVNKNCYISSSGGITVPNVIAINPTVRTIKRTVREISSDLVTFHS